MTEEEMIARGKEVFEECYGGVIPLPQEIDPKGYSGLSMKMFNDVWGDGQLSFREKRLVVLGALAGLGADPSLFEIHAKSALGNGELTANELRAMILMATPYVGLPYASPLYLALEKLIAEHEEG
ncbi:MAG: carboxymuconolactone decarboxylase family protein [Deltaproteobacteria bacterium]|jgi:alkylhydroperoxidase/carboxymuconolactone decarboxylase family protein YurZ|nr:carboxymuconolactone decarboxylase family protein [Deltaproteobacteria bacterium]MBW2496594.1 carboxymuconolactone decarboxylase family protein [Deltaproteobacteria bacterium]